MTTILLPMEPQHPDRCELTGEIGCTKCAGEYCETHGCKPCDCDSYERHVDQNAKHPGVHWGEEVKA